MRNYLAAFIVIILLVILGAIAIGGSNTNPSYSQKDPNKPIAQVNEKSFNLGDMNVNDTKAYDFSITNTGKKDLTLNRISTSCDCTFAKIIKADGTESPNLTMNSANQWQTSLKTGESAKLRVTYKPSIMPLEGLVDRYATVATNDPDNPKLEFKVSAKVSK
ncbi:MAG: DUF1573 domain-containing protein [bacterium]|nr:DUF1573 domain-containing protein [bacterium]